MLHRCTCDRVGGLLVGSPGHSGAKCTVDHLSSYCSRVCVRCELRARRLAALRLQLVLRVGLRTCLPYLAPVASGGARRHSAITTS
jgi:hypothetical protein